MFCGLIEEVGTISARKQTGGSLLFECKCDVVLGDLKVGDSISVNGVCQTVTALSEHGFGVCAVEETLTKTTMKNFAVGTRVNLERAMLPTTRFGGHIVQGHVDCSGAVRSVTELDGSFELWIEQPEGYSQYLIKVGSICVDGVSLTVADVGMNTFKVAIIPHTWSNTCVSTYQKGTQVNLEFDVLAKYVERMIAFKHFS